MKTIRSVSLIAILTMGLVGAGIGVIPGARSDNATCQQACNGLYASCNDECSGADNACNAGCDELADPGDCRSACRSANQACKGSCGDFKSECKNACPRGKQESPTDPLP